MGINEIEYTDLARLNPKQFSDILLRLLKFESEKYNFKRVKIILVPLNINVADGGEDGRIECDDTKDSRWITNPLSIFQVKACNLKPENLFSEFFSTRKGGEKRLKEQIEEILDRGGDYVFFISHNYGPEAIKRKRAKADKAIDYCNSVLGKSYKKEQVRILEGNQIKDWVNEHINVVIKVKEYLKHIRPDWFKTIEEWGTFDYLSQNNFISNDWIKEQIAIIRAELMIPRSVFRIIGYSGVGKSRLVYEAFKASSNGLKSNAIYIDSGTADPTLVSKVANIVPSNQCIFIVDNCNKDQHDKLKQEIIRTSSKCSLITIDMDVSEFDANSGPGGIENYIYYENTFNKNIIPQLIKKEVGYPLNDLQIEWISDMTAYFPEMALKFAHVVKFSQGNFNCVINEATIKKVLFGGKYADTNGGDELYSIAKVFSIFKYFPDPLTYLASEAQNAPLMQSQIKFIVSQVCDPEISPKKYNEACQFFIENRVLLRRGRYLMMALMPLSIMLANKWWQSCSINDACRIFIDSPQELKISIIERFKYLDFAPQTKKIAEALFGEDGHFANIKDFCTDWGSQLFCALVEINPEALLKTLIKLYKKKPFTDLVNSDAGRQNVIWGLQKLCFNRNTFDQAARILYGFTQSENKSLRDHSSSIFIQLFKPYLSGTEATLDDRLQILKFALDQNFSKCSTVSINAIFAGFSVHYSMRGEGPEKQGLRILKDFEPSWAELDAYWGKLKEFLVKIWEENQELRDSINSKLFSQMCEILRYDTSDFIFELLKFLEENGLVLPSAVIYDFENALEGENFSVDKINKIKRFLENHHPDDLKTELLRNVVEAQYRHKIDEKGNYFDESQEKSKEVGRDFAHKKIILNDFLGYLSTGQQMYTSHFIEEYCRNLGDAALVDELWTNSIKTLLSTSEANRNYAVLDGILKTLDHSACVEKVIAISQYSGISGAVILLAKLHFKTKQDLIKLVKLYEEGELSLEILTQIRFAWFIFDAPFEPVKYVCDFFNSLGTMGKLTVISILNRRLLREYSDLEPIEHAYIKDFLLKNNLFGIPHIPQQFKYYDSVNLIVKFLKNNNDRNFTKQIIDYLILYLKSDYFSPNGTALVEVFKLLTESYFSLFWKSLSEELLSSHIVQTNVRHTLGAIHGNDPFGSSEGLLFFTEDKHETIMKWCKDNPKEGVELIARMMPIFDFENKTWHPFAKKMIDEFGDNPDFLLEMNKNMKVFGSIHSRLEYYLSQITLLSQLKEHSRWGVRNFANNEISNLTKLVESQKVEEEERFLGI